MHPKHKQSNWNAHGEAEEEKEDEEGVVDSLPDTGRGRS